MRKANQDLLLGTAVAMVLAAGCAQQAPTKPPPASVVSPAPAQPATDNSPAGIKPADKPNEPADESALAGASNAELIDKLASAAEGETAAVVLAKRGGSEVSDALLAALAHQDWQVRARAAFALGLMGKDAAAAKPALERAAAEDVEQTVRDAAAFALDAIAESK
jgi:HEAT repeat protein